ncbi:hypothetical protein [Undibacterium fentianense]|uniref:Sel1 repeat family protein n=1 Tax=Undibacterium fentianense TaxID=2828728 RepID=A0A941ICW9_9BURK|nr:hypothetical protein [Undibacterium fentianense]MBR7799323.1 hypothetical protein [Undibacterium fentianense]
MKISLSILFGSTFTILLLTQVFNDEKVVEQLQPIHLDARIDDGELRIHPNTSRSIQSRQSSPWEDSPFSIGSASVNKQNGAAINKADLLNDDEYSKRLQLELRDLPEKMKALKYLTPLDLMRKSDDELWKLAREKNPYAINLLAERTNWSGKKSPDELNKFDQLRIDLKSSLLQGHIKSASTLGSMSLNMGDKIEAMAWYFVANSMGDTIATRYFENTEFFLEASEAEKLQARQRADERMINIRHGRLN